MHKKDIGGEDTGTERGSIVNSAKAEEEKKKKWTHMSDGIQVRCLIVSTTLFYTSCALTVPYLSFPLFSDFS